MYSTEGYFLTVALLCDFACLHNMELLCDAKTYVYIHIIPNLAYASCGVFLARVCLFTINMCSHPHKKTTLKMNLIDCLTVCE